MCKQIDIELCESLLETLEECGGEAKAVELYGPGTIYIRYTAANGEEYSLRNEIHEEQKPF